MNSWMPRDPRKEAPPQRLIEKCLTDATQSFDKYRVNPGSVQMAILFKNLDRLFAAMNTQKTKDLKSTIWYDLYFRFFLARMSGWEFLLVALPLFLISFFVEVFVCYPGNINIPKAVIAIIVLCESLEFIVQLVLCWTRLRKCPTFYRKWGIRIKTPSGIVVVAFKAAEIYSICKLVPNS